MRAVEDSNWLGYMLVKESFTDKFRRIRKSFVYLRRLVLLCYYKIFIIIWFVHIIKHIKLKCYTYINTCSLFKQAFYTYMNFAVYWSKHPVALNKVYQNLSITRSTLQSIIYTFTLESTAPRQATPRAVLAYTQTQYQNEANDNWCRTRRGQSDEKTKVARFHLLHSFCLYIQIILCLSI